MRKNLVKYLLHFQSKEKSFGYKILSLIAGMLFFLVILPAIFIWIAFFTEKYILIEVNRNIEIFISIISLFIGLFFLIWTTIFQWKIGKGIPTPNIPTQHLVVSGPYAICRNPIELGAILYYLGIGTIVGGIWIGIVCLMLGLIIGSAYHKFIEEQELEERFGEDYRQYKQKTPFLFPQIKLSKIENKLKTQNYEREY
jgi:protein-S-isoprenylcysteine O-methyltransferase Ste14